MNHVHLIGVAEKAAVRKEVGKESKPVTSFTLVTTKTYKDKEYKQYHRIVCWGGVADDAENVRENDMVSVTGSIQTRSYEDKDGAKKNITEIVASTIVVSSSVKKAAPFRNSSPENDIESIPF